MMEFLNFMFWGLVISISLIGLIVLFVLLYEAKSWIADAMMSDEEKANKKYKIAILEYEHLQKHGITADESRKISQEASEKRIIYGLVNPVIICPQCQTKGLVHTKPFDKKNGISGAKATGAILTGGVSLLLTGLSGSDYVTKAHCDNCNTDWEF